MIDSITKWLIVVSFIPVLLSCSQKGMSNFLDISDEGEPTATAPTTKSDNNNTGASSNGSMSRPIVESSTNWKVVEKQIPKDASGGPDWSAALREGVIDPRRAVSGPGDPEKNKKFNYDFYLAGPTPEYDAYFPHSVHTEWLQCSNCHPKIFRTRGVKMTMADMYAGKFCGTCHGSVAFGLNACVRCHTGLGGAK